MHGSRKDCAEAGRGVGWGAEVAQGEQEAPVHSGQL